MSLPAAALTLVLHAEKVAMSRMIAWSAILVIAVLIRVGHLMYCRRNLPDQPEETRWRVLLIVAYGVSGLAWGTASFLLFVPGSYPTQLVMAAIVWGVAVTVTLQAAYLPAFRTFVLASMLPFVWVFLAQGTIDYLATGGMLLALLMVTDVLASARQRILRELTELRLELAQKKEAAEQAYRAKSHFLAAASHDLRQPLHALALYLGALPLHVQTSAGREITNNMHLAVDALQKLLNALLDISRLDAGAVQPVWRAVSVASLVERLFIEFEPEARDKGLSLETNGCAQSVRSDPVLLETVLRNLVGNAVRYTAHGSVTVACRCEGSNVWLSVQDTGMGIAPEYQSRVFDEFFQVGNAGRDRSQGLGLGLAIVRRQLALLDHEWRLESVPEQGTAFHISLPQATAADVAAEEVQVSTIPGTLAPMVRLKLLVVEDDELVRSSTRTLVEGWGLQVQMADSLEQARQLIAREAPDAIIADYRLGGGMDGAQVIRTLQADLGREVPAILMTGDIDPDSLREVAQSGLPVLHKPVAPARLRAFVQRVQRALAKTQPQSS